jgi:hypothetical protein
VRGHRHLALYIYSLLIRRNGKSDAEILEHCRTLARSCRPIPVDSEVRRCIRAAKGACNEFGRSISYATLAKMLNLTPDEKLAIKAWQPVRRNVCPHKKVDRRRLIQSVLEKEGLLLADRTQWMPTRTMSRVLAEKYKITASHVTLAKDYRALHKQLFNTDRGSACTTIPESLVDDFSRSFPPYPPVSPIPNSKSFQNKGDCGGGDEN